MEPKVLDLGFKTVMRLPLPEKEGIAGMTDLRRASEFQIGVGDRAMKVDRSGQWLGANRFDDAPFSVDIDGNVIAESLSLSSSVSINAGIGLNQQFTSSTPTTVTGSSFTVTLERQLRVLLHMTGSGWVEQNGVGDFVGNGVVVIYIDSAQQARTVIGGGIVGSDNQGITRFGSMAVHRNLLIPAGTYTISLKGHCDAIVGSPRFNLYNYQFSLVTLGTS